MWTDFDLRISVVQKTKPCVYIAHSDVFNSFKAVSCNSHLIKSHNNRIQKSDPLVLVVLAGANYCWKMKSSA